MEEKNVIKIKLSTAICITVIITILVGLVVFLGVSYYKNNTGNEELKQNNNQEAGQEDKKEENKTIISEEINEKEKLDIKSDLVKKVYKYIPIADFLADENNKPMKTAYQSKKVKINDLSNNVKLINIFKNLELKEEQKTYYLEDAWYYFSKEVLENKALEIYGKDIQIKNERFDINWSESCNYENGKYYYSEGGSGPSIDSIREIKEAYIENDTLYIIDKFMLGRTIEAEDSTGATYSESYNLYTNTEMEYLIAKEYGEIEQSSLINKNRDKMTEYKHTFKKGDNGEYYWYSSEPII